jgi:hypothetical protein
MLHQRFQPSQDMAYQREHWHIGSLDRQLHGFRQVPSGIQSQASIGGQYGIWQSGHPGQNGLCFPTQPKNGCRAFQQTCGI